jgi:hypothetical protein
VPSKTAGTFAADRLCYAIHSRRAGVGSDDGVFGRQASQSLAVGPEAEFDCRRLPQREQRNSRLIGS